MSTIRSPWEKNKHPLAKKLKMILAISLLVAAEKGAFFGLVKQLSNFLTLDLSNGNLRRQENMAEPVNRVSMTTITTYVGMSSFILTLLFKVLNQHKPQVKKKGDWENLFTALSFRIEPLLSSPSNEVAAVSRPRKASTVGYLSSKL